MQTGQRLAAVDMGSNSFRLEIAKLELGQLQRMEYHKETVRQGAGLDADRRLSQDAMQRGWNCLARFAERLSSFETSQVRAVATQTLREARNRDEFIGRAQDILGFPIDVISGREEARLIYQGVAHLLPQSDERRLVLDIGGRSTELIIGSGYTPHTMESYRVGSVAWSMRYFPDGQLSTKNFERAEIAAKAVMDEAITTHGPTHWDVVYGCSGTVGAIADALLAAGRVPARHIVTRDNLHWLRDKLIKARRTDAIRLEGIKEDRQPVIAGGLAVLCALTDLLDIDQLQYAYGALRHGALYDMLDRAHHDTDVRAAAIESLALRFQIDQPQAARVARTALRLFSQIGTGLKKKQRHEAERQIEWAARLHEIGVRISHADHHKHGAYILDNTDASGFALHELHHLSRLVLGHRGKLRKLETALDDPLFVQQLLALRLAVILCHARQDPDDAHLTLRSDKNASDQGLVLSFRKNWDHDWPQSAHLLREEVLAWQRTPWSLRLRAC
ncbi:exopolyphosphatase [Ottowia sp.]|uniref:exopolyphosphatase n=1 Tax=Ottowia sp. TaxID=1898956 RepID=UPI003A885C18